MSKIYLVRHGQASLGKANYDQLSSLGEAQASQLGKHLAQLDATPSIVITGSMARHQQTAEGVLAAFDGHKVKQVIDPNWNEFDFEALIREYLSTLASDEPKPTKPSEFFSALRRALQAWSEGKLADNLPETWQQFEQRIQTALQELMTLEQERVFVFSSGGAISMAIKHIMRLDAHMMIDLNLQTRNTGVTELFAKNGQCYVSSVNHIAHLLTPEHKEMVTYA
jgi:broad specificity phosphatase PhoE